MGDLEPRIEDLRTIQEEIRRAAKQGSLMLVDLAGSTEYKTQNGEDAWLVRLADFYNAVRIAVSPLSPVKYMGDGILCYFPEASASPSEALELARKVFLEVDRVNAAREYRPGHAMQVRIVLGHGKVFLLNRVDPQGTTVDKLFRMEKHVPTGYIGMSEEFSRLTAPAGSQSIGRFALKGLSPARQPILVVGPFQDLAPPYDLLLAAKRRGALHELWDLGKAGQGKILLVGGYIPPQPGEPYTVQMGDKEAILRAFRNLAIVGRLEDVHVTTSRDVREADLRENVVSIGGPYWNLVTLRFMREVRSPFVFDFSDPNSDRTPLIDCLSGAVHSALWAGHRLVRDHGFFARLQNPFNAERHVVLACGIETQAVDGAIQAFSSDHAQFLDLYHAIARLGDDTSLPDFFCHMPFDIEDTGVTRLPSAHDQTARILTNWSHGHSGELQVSATPH